MEATSGTKWPEVSRSEPCVVCGKKSWCKRSPNGKWSLCRRVESDKPGMGDGWLHSLNGERRLPVIQIKEEAEPVIDWTVFATRLRSNRDHELTNKQVISINAEEERQRLAAKIGVKVESLQALWVGYGIEEGVSKYGKPWKQEYWSFPERNHQGRVTGIVRRIDKSGTGLPDKKLSMKGGRSGVYYEPLWFTRSGPVYIAEGGSDTAALISMGASAIGRPSCSSAKCLVDLLGKYKKPIRVLAERDEHPENRGQIKSCPLDCEGCSHCWPGKKGAEVVAGRLVAALPKHKIEVWFPPHGFKDVREFYQHNPTATSTDWQAAIQQEGRV